jgi:hypothetical protein
MPARRCSRVGPRAAATSPPGPQRRDAIHPPGFAIGCGRRPLGQVRHCARARRPAHRTSRAGRLAAPSRVCAPTRCTGLDERARLAVGVDPSLQSLVAEAGERLGTVVQEVGARVRHALETARAYAARNRRDDALAVLMRSRLSTSCRLMECLLGRELLGIEPRRHNARRARRRHPLRPAGEERRCSGELRAPGELLQRHATWAARGTPSCSRHLALAGSAGVESASGDVSRGLELIATRAESVATSGSAATLGFMSQPSASFATPRVAAGALLCSSLSIGRPTSTRGTTAASL